MGYYSNQIFTNRGLEAIARAGAKESEMIFTTIKTGTGSYTDQEISELSDAIALKEEKQSFPINSIFPKDNTIQFQSIISNEGVSEQYSIMEIGLYAKEGEDGDEFLVSISLNTDNPAVVPVYADVPIEMKIADFIAVSNTENFKVEYRSAAYVTTEEMRRLINGLPIVSYDEDEEMIIINTGSVAGTGAVLDQETLIKAIESVTGGKSTSNEVSIANFELDSIKDGSIDVTLTEVTE